MTNTNELYRARNKALSKTKNILKKRNKIIKPVKAKDKSLLFADFYMNGILCKFKMTRNSQVNILFEMENNGRTGWFQKTRAKYFVFYIEPEDKIYIIDIIKVKDYISNPLHKVETTKKGTIGDGYSYMIPIRVLLDHNLIKEVIKNNE